MQPHSFTPNSRAESLAPSRTVMRRADVIVDADGIYSAVRASLIGPDAPPFTGKVC
jgi:2-polyprenyl-6-methoxyphenol hydroxylase-like FAD-dependent oxidoreductase